MQISANSINNTVGSISAQGVALHAVQDINNIGGTVAADANLLLQAGRDININSTTQSSSGAGGGYQFSQSGIDRLAAVYTRGPGSLVASAGNDITLTAAQISSAGDVQVNAGNSLTLSALSRTRSDNFGAGNPDNHFLSSSSKDIGTTITSAGSTTLTAGSTLSATAANVNASGDLTLHAQDIALLAGQSKARSDAVMTNSSSDLFSSTTTVTKESHASAHAQLSILQGKNVSVIADQNLLSVGTEFKGTDSVHVEGKDTSALYAATDTEHSTRSTQSTSSFLGLAASDNKTTDEMQKSTAIGTSLVSNQKVQINVGNQAVLQGANIESQEIAFTKTDPTKAGELILGGSTDTTQTSHTEKGDSALGLWQASKGSGSTTQTLNQTTLKGSVTFDSALKITAQIPDTKGGSEIKTQIQALAMQTAGLDYLNQLAANPTVQWDQVALAHEQWHYDQQGLSGAGAALVAVVVAYCTMGAGTAALGTTAAAEGAAVGVTTTTLAGTTLATTTAATAGAAAATTYTVAGAALNAGISALASEAAVVMANNGGDIGKTLEQLGSSESIKNVLIAMGTAGVGAAVSGQGVSAVAAQTATGCATGAISGSGCEQGAKMTAILSGAGETYRYLVGYVPSAGPGENRFGTKLDGSSTDDGSYDPVKNGQFPVYGQQQRADYGMNVIGLNEAGSFLWQGETLSRTLNQVPFINATAGLHDYIFNANPDLNFTIWNVPTMLPAAALSIPAALDNPNISWLMHIKIPQIDQTKPSTILMNSNQVQKNEGARK